ncbi:MAG: TldD/PmbA family protein [Candidatus Bathyarchaeota archaeon]
MKEILAKGIDKGIELGGSFIDVRVEKVTSEGVGAEDGDPKDAEYSTEWRVGARALAGGSWGFAASILEEKRFDDVIFNVIEEAVKLAKAVRSSSRRIELAEIRPIEDKIDAKFQIDPKDIPIEEKMNICTEASKRMLRFNSAISKAAVGISTILFDKIFTSSEGAYIQQSQLFVFGRLFANATKAGISEFYTHTEGGAKGFETLREYDLVEHSEETAKKALNLAEAKPAKAMKSTVILDPEFVSLLVHEIVGHPSEADRLIGKEAAWAGRAWWKDKIGQKVFSEGLSVVSDATLEGFLGSFRYDDEGVPAQRIVNIDKGLLKELLQSRETAKIFDSQPNGAMRAATALHAPLIRMTNTFIDKGDWKVEEMFEGVEEGIYLKGEKVPSIDSRRYNFRISAKEAFLIKKGEISELLRGASLTGTSPNFLSNLDAIGNDLKVFPIPNCGKGDPMQVMRVGNGGPHIRGYGVIVESG